MREGARSGLVAAGLLAACALIFFSCFERREIERSIVDTAEAKANPFLVAEKFLEEMGADLETDHQGVPPSPGATWILPTSRAQSLDPDDVGTWVEGGGRLLLMGDRCGCTWDEVPLLAEWGIVPVTLESSLGTRQEVPILGRTAPLRTALSDAIRLEAPGLATRFVLEDEHGALILGFAVGAGEVILAVNDVFVRNPSIGTHDHAELFWRLLGAGHPSATLRWSRGGRNSDAATPGLLALLWGRARPLMIAGLVLLFAWVWMRARRFGPMQPDPPPIRRRLLEHIEAAGQFAWRRNRGAELLDAVRHSLERECARRHPGWRGFSEQERTQHLAAAAKLPVGIVARALRDPEVPDAESFRERIVHLEQIRKAL